MEISIFEQIEANLYAFILGCFLWGIYELLKLIRMIFYWDFSEKFRNKMSNKIYKRVKNPINIKYKHKNKIEFTVMLVFDIVYFAILSIIFPTFIYIVNGGIFRWYIFLFAFLGYLTLKLTLGRVVNFLIELFVFYFRIVVLLIKNPIVNKIDALKNKIKMRKQKRIINKEKKIKRNILISFGK